MATFIRLCRAFAAQSYLLWAHVLALGASCARPPVALLSRATAPGLVRAAPTASHEPSDLAAEPGGGKAAWSAHAAESTLGARIELSFDEAYPAGERPRATDPEQASLDDEQLARWNLGGSSEPNYTSSRPSFHPGTRVVVDTELTRRRVKPKLGGPFLSADEVLAQTRSKGYRPFRSCFETGQRERKGTGGVTRIAFTIGTRGTVSSARLLSSHLGNARSAACLLTELRKLRFLPRPAERINVLASVSLWPGDVELTPASTMPLAADEAHSGDFEPSAVRACLLDKQPALIACFDVARRIDEALWGRLALTVNLEMDGSVHRVSEVESHFPSAGALRCAAAAIAEIVFPSVKGKPFSFVLAMRLAPSAKKAPNVVRQDAGIPTELPDDTHAPSD